MSLIVLEVEDRKMGFFKKLISHFSFVKVAEEQADEDTDEEVRENIRAAVQELREIEAGKKEGIPIDVLLKSL